MSRFCAAALQCATLASSVARSAIAAMSLPLKCPSLPNALCSTGWHYKSAADSAKCAIAAMNQLSPTYSIASTICIPAQIRQVLLREFMDAGRCLCRHSVHELLVVLTCNKAMLNCWHAASPWMLHSGCGYYCRQSRSIYSGMFGIQQHPRTQFCKTPDLRHDKGLSIWHRLHFAPPQSMCKVNVLVQIISYRIGQLLGVAL